MSAAAADRGGPGAILRDIKAIAPPGRQSLDQASLRRLKELTRALVESSPSSRREYERYLERARSSITLPHELLANRLRGRTVLITGASGCIGRALLAQLAPFSPDRIVTVDIARAPSCRVRVDHRQVDVRNRESLNATLADAAPHVVFHLAAQRNPARAERDVLRTVSTNIFGARNVIDACARANVEHLVFASTGKALRPYVREVYAASKRAAELLVTEAATQGVLRASATRFTHVVDNAIVVDRFRRWCRAGEVVKVHATDMPFYAQSALESAQLLLVAALWRREAELGIHVIRNLDWPVSALDLAVGIMAEEGIAPLRITGPEPGYEEQAYQGLFDPAVAWDASPLLNAFETPTIEACSSADVDVVGRRFRVDKDVQRIFARLEACCASRHDESAARGVLDDLSRALFDATLADVPTSTLRRVARLTEPQRGEMTPTNLWIDDRLRAWAAIDQPTRRMTAG